MEDDKRVAELTVGQLRQLIRLTVQEAMAEVLVEFSIAAEYDAQLVYQAEMTEWLRTTLAQNLYSTDD